LNVLSHPFIQVGDGIMRRVALLIETSREFGRGLLRGIARYNQEHEQWLTYCRPHGLGDMSYAWLRGWQGDGVLARITDRRMAASLAKLKVPIINLRAKLAGLPFPYVGVDNETISRMVAAHLLSRGFRHFGFCGYRRGYSAAGDRRCDAFLTHIQSTGYRADVCAASEPSFGQRERGSWRRELGLIARWIRDLPRPVAVMACTDDRGLQVLEACRQIGVAVPDEVAVIGVANDECLCSLSIPPMSSVDVNAEQIGYRAATLLDELLDSGRVPAKVLIEPRGVVCRRSTDVLAIEDQQVAAAIQYIRDHACERVYIEDVTKRVHLSRSALELRFKQAIGRTVGQEIQQTRIARAQQMLAENKLPIKQVAQRAGFRSVQYMTRVFRAMIQQTPAAYRRAKQA
jgi:LacI family transcriptional regulator